MGKVNLKTLFIRGFRAARRDGFWKTFRAAIKTYVTSGHIADPFDLRYQTDTAGVVPLWRLRVNSPNARFAWRYETSNPEELKACISHIPAEPENLSFIDLGCGKGRMLIAARDLGFQKLVGVEFAPELFAIANSNLAKASVNNAILLNEDASEFKFPAEDFILYLFNPFSEEVMKRVLENLGQVTSCTGFVIYNNARCAALFDSSGFLYRIASVQNTRHPTIIWSLRKSVS